jgi:hypothetical protein
MSCQRAPARCSPGEALPGGCGLEAQAAGLKPGQKIEAIQYLDRIELIPVRPIRAMRGSLKELALPPYRFFYRTAAKVA